MIDPREILQQELERIGISTNQAALIALEAGSSQCVVNKKYLKELEIDNLILDKVHQKVIEFYTGELFDTE